MAARWTRRSERGVFGCDGASRRRVSGTCKRVGREQARSLPAACRRPLPLPANGGVASLFFYPAYLPFVLAPAQRRAHVVAKLVIERLVEVHLLFFGEGERERELEEKERKDERRRAISTVFVSFARGVRCVFSFCFGSVKVQQRSRETDGTCPRGCECRGAQSRKSGRTRLSSPSLRSIFCASRRRRAAMPSFFSRPLPLSTLSSLFFPSSIFSSA